MSLSKVFENELQLTKTCFNMEMRGILIDQEYALTAKAYEQTLVDKARANFLKDTGEEFRDSPKLLAKVFDARGEPYPLTDKGNPSFKNDLLVRMDTPLTRIINEIRYYDKRVSTYYTPFLQKLGPDKRLRANIQQAGTQTGRFSMSTPNLQNVPKEDDKEKAYYIRRCMKPAPGKVFVMMDYDQVEYRLLMDYARQMDVVEEIKRGGDVHQITADMLGVDRKLAKTVNFSILYGVGQKALSELLKIPVPEAVRLRAHYFHKLPQVRRFIRKVQDTAISRGFVYNWLGRKCHLVRRDLAYKMPNHLIQGGCADIIKVAMNRIEQECGAKAGMLINVHDELLFEMHLDDLHLIPRIKEIMESVYLSDTGLKFTVGVEWSKKSWSWLDQEKDPPFAKKGLGDVREQIREGVYQSAPGP